MRGKVIITALCITIAVSFFVLGLFWGHRQEPESTAIKSGMQRDTPADASEKTARTQRIEFAHEATTAGGPLDRGNERPQVANTFLDQKRSITSADRNAYFDRVARRVSSAQMQRFVAASGLSGQPKERLEQLLSNKLMVHADVESAAKSTGINAEINGPMVKNLEKAQTAEVNAQIRALVGDTLFKDIDSNLYALPSDLYSVEYVGAAIMKGMPLTPEQITTLDAAIGHNRADGLSRIPDLTTGMSEDDQRLIDAGGPFLTPDQVRLLVEIRYETNLYAK